MGNEVMAQLVAKAFRFFSSGEVENHWVKGYEELENGNVRVTIEVEPTQAMLYLVGNAECLEALRDTEEIETLIKEIGDKK